jgi:ATP-dependent Clp protease ATP-binding subunit ClpA
VGAPRLDASPQLGCLPAGAAVILARAHGLLRWSHDDDWTGTEHLLLGLIGEGGGVAARALESLGIRLDTVRRQVEEIIGQGGQAPPGHVPFTARAKKVLELAFREARALGHGYIGTGHILLGLIRDGDGVAAQVLVRLGAGLNRARGQVSRLLRAGQGDDDVLARVGLLDRRLAAIELHRPELLRSVETAGQDIPDRGQRQLPQVGGDQGLGQGAREPYRVVLPARLLPGPESR